MLAKFASYDDEEVDLDEELDEEDDDPELSLVEPEEEVPTPIQVCKASITKAKSAIDKFFADKMMHCGGRIPKKLLHDPTTISMVINTSIKKGVRLAYRLLEHTITVEEAMLAKKTGDSTKDIKLVNETLQLLASSRVPQQFAGGMLVMYIELVEGVAAS
jgi:hypothetical protein